MARPPAIQADTAFRVTINLQSVGLTDDQFNRLCSDNRHSRIELTADKQLIIMSPCGPDTSRRNAKITMRLGIWADQDSTGLCFGPDAIFSLLNGAKRSPDASWIPKRRWNRLMEEERLGITPICPDFIIELRSISDRVADLQEKMEEYFSNGAKLGWLLDYLDNRAVIYRPGQTPLTIDKPEIISGDPILKGFHFDFRDIL